MLTPNGKPAGKIDRIMLLAMWANYLHKEKNNNPNITRPEIIAAGMGKPTFPINDYAALYLMQYWGNISMKSQEVRRLHSNKNIGPAMLRSKVAESRAAIDYGDPQGDMEARAKMATALSLWYEFDINEKNILFTVGGAGGLKIIFEIINKKFPNCRIITPFPHYSLYAGSSGKNRLHPINVMQEPGYRLTAKNFNYSLQNAINLAKKDGGFPKALLLCDPNNPLGTIIDKEELRKIADVLRNYTDLYIILDEAYAEMCFDGKKNYSLLTIAPDLRERIILMRSATKALSAAGERMAVILSFDENLMTAFIKESINNYGHAPRSLQIAFSETMMRFTDSERQAVMDFYKPQVEYVSERLTAMGASMPDSQYKVEGTFYVVGDFSDLIGLDLPTHTYTALNKSGKIRTDEDITYYLLFEDGVMVAPLSYFGLSNTQGYMRITCSGGDQELKILMDRLERRLIMARKEKQLLLEQKIADSLTILRKFDIQKHNEITAQIFLVLHNQYDEKSIAAIKLKESNLKLKNILLNINLIINKNVTERKIDAAVFIQSFFRGYLARKETRKKCNELDNDWSKFVDKLAPNSNKLKSYFLSFSISDRLEFAPWKEYLKTRTDGDSKNILTYLFQGRM